MRSRFAIFVGFLLMAGPGCMYYGGYPYGYYGPGPSVVPQQPWPNAPVNPAYPVSPGYPGGYPAGTSPYPTPIDGSSPIYTPGNPPSTNPLTPTYQQPGGNSAPYSPNPTNSGVPNPNDVGTPGNPQGSNTNLTPTQTSRVQEDLSTPFEQNGAGRLRRNFADESTADAEPQYHQPIRQTSQTSFDNDIGAQQANRQTLSKSFGHHPQFEWLKGTVEYDDAIKCWVIIYDENPPRTDKLGGSVTLVGNSALDRLQDGEVVRVEGAIDRATTDSAGKPVYRVNRLRQASER